MIFTKYDTTRNSLIRRRANRDAIFNVLASEQTNIKDLKDKVQQLGDGITLVQTFATTLQSDVVHKFEDLLTRGVRAVFQEDVKIIIEFSSSANNVNADFMAVLPDGKKINIAVDGGGLRDLVGVLMRLLYLVLEPTMPSKIMLLDESFKALDANRAAIAFKFIADVARELGIQCVWITHAGAARAMSEVDGASVLEISKVDGVSQVKLVKE